jgi:predicted dehydrogenase
MPYKIALIGCGRVGVWLEDDPLRVKPASHLGGIKKIIDNQEVKKGLELVAICDINNERLLRCRDRWKPYIKGDNLYPDYKELICKEKPDIIIIATWTSSHRDIAVYAAQNGIKGIVLEKPAAGTLTQAREIVNMCKHNNIKLVVNHERRWGPLYRKTKEIVENKTLGQLKLIYGNVLSRSAPRGAWQDVLKEVGGGPLLHDGTHLIDMVRYFIGDIDTVNGYVNREDPAVGVETTATALLGTKNGVTVFIEAGGMRDYFNFEMDLQFERGRIKVGNGIQEYFVCENSRRYTGFKDLVPASFPELPADTDPFTGAISEVIKAMEEDSEPQSSGIDGFKAMEVIFAIYYSAYLTGKTLHLPVKPGGHPLEKMFKAGMLG